MIVTSAVSSRIAAASAAGSIRPSRATGSRVISKPRRASASTCRRMALCSTAVVITWRRAGAARRADSTAELFDSVPPLVKMISAGSAPMAAATCSRARSSARPAREPRRYGLDGLPYSSPRNGSIASSTSGRTRVVALLSR